MQSQTTRNFWRLFHDLPPDAQREAKRAYNIFQANPAHPGPAIQETRGRAQSAFTVIRRNFRIADNPPPKMATLSDWRWRQGSLVQKLHRPNVALITRDGEVKTDAIGCELTAQ